MLSAVFRYVLPEISESSVLQDLVRPIAMARPVSAIRAPPWDLAKVLRFLRGVPFEPIIRLLCEMSPERPFPTPFNYS